MREIEDKQGRSEGGGSLPVGPQTAPGTGKLIPVYVMGKRYMVPETLTIMKAMEYALSLIHI